MAKCKKSMASQPLEDNFVGYYRRNIIRVKNQNSLIENEREVKIGFSLSWIVKILSKVFGLPL